MKNFQRLIFALVQIRMETFGVKFIKKIKLKSKTPSLSLKKHITFKLEGSQCTKRNNVMSRIFKNNSSLVGVENFGKE